MRLVLFHHADPIMEFFYLLCVKDIEALLTYKFVADVVVLLVQVVAEGLLSIEVGADTVRADKLLVMALCCTVGETAYVSDEGVVGGLLVLVVVMLTIFVALFIPHTRV